MNILNFKNESLADQIIGPTGPQGDTGDTGIQGPTGPTGPAAVIPSTLTVDVINPLSNPYIEIDEPNGLRLGPDSIISSNNFPAQGIDFNGSTGLEALTKLSCNAGISTNTIEELTPANNIQILNDVDMNVNDILGCEQLTVNILEQRSGSYVDVNGIEMRENEIRFENNTFFDNELSTANVFTTQFDVNDFTAFDKSSNMWCLSIGGGIANPEILIDNTKIEIRSPFDQKDAAPLEFGNTNATFVDITPTLRVDTITEKTADNGVLIETVLIKDGNVGLDDTDSIFKTFLQSTSTNTADRTLTLDVNDADRTLTIAGNATVDQDVSTTGSPSFTAVSAATITATTTLRSDSITDEAGSGAPDFDNGLTMSAGSILDTYIEDTHVSTLSGIWAVAQNITILISKVGNVVTLSWPNVLATANTASNITLDVVLDAAYRPTGNGFTRYVRIQDNAVLQLGELTISTGGALDVFVGDNIGNFAGAGSSGLATTSVTYRT